jgi:crotonobetainyl-CoA:carnitine CoA-transferase CaiB-like acyl-CoA transferase
VAADPQLAARGLYQVMEHPLLDHPVPSESGPAPFTRIPRAPLRPAPMPGQHTRDVCTRVLGLSDAAVDDLVARGAAFTYPADTTTASP